MGSVGSSISNAVSRPFEQLADSTVKVFTDPAHANLGDFVSAINPLGATIVNDVKHPQDAAIQAAGASLVAGGAALLGGSGSSALGAGTGANGLEVALPAGQGGAYLAAPVGSIAAQASTPALLAANGLPAASSGAGTGGFLSSLASGLTHSLGSVSSEVGSIVKSIAPTLGALYIQEQALQKSLANKLGFGSSGPTTGGTTIGLTVPGNASGGLFGMAPAPGAPAGNSGQPQPILAASSWIMIFVVLGVLVTVFGKKIFGHKKK